MKKYVSIMIIVLMLALCFNLNPASSEAVNAASDTGITLYVGGSGPGNYSTIQSAINVAQDGDTVFVYADSSPYYEQSLIIYYSIELIGENKYTTVIDGEHRDRIIIINADNVTIRGFTIQNANTGIDCTTSNIIISDNIILSNYFGIDATGNVTIRENVILNNNLGIRFSRARGRAIIERNAIESNNYAIFLYGAVSVDIINNNIQNNGVHSVLERFPRLLKSQGYFSEGMDSNQNWNGNYWGRPRLFPMPIFGYTTSKQDIGFLMVFWDKRPALKPYDIG